MKNTTALRRAVVETLEGRRLLTFTGGNFDLPFVNDFSQGRNGIEDANGLNTGFPIVQGNAANDEYQPGLIDLDTATGFLNLTSRGSAANGGNFGADNSLVNGLQLPFDAAAGTWLVHARISATNAPLSQFDTPFEQGGILFGPTQDNFVKLVFANDGSNTVVQFVAENKVGGTFNYPGGGENGYKSTVTGVRGVNLDTANYIDLYLSGDPGTGTLSAQYRVEGGQTIRLADTITIPEAQRAAFFRAQGGRAGLLVQNKNDAGPITVAFDEFGVTREGLPSNQPAVDQVRPAAGATDIDRDGFVGVDLILPNAGLDEGSLTSDTVKLTRVSDGRQVPAKINTSGGGDAIILQPLQILDAETQYRFEITGGVNDVYGVAFVPYSQTFTTGFGISRAASDVAFEKIALPPDPRHPLQQRRRRPRRPPLRHDHRRPDRPLGPQRRRHARRVAIDHQRHRRRGRPARDDRPGLRPRRHRQQPGGLRHAHRLQRRDHRPPRRVRRGLQRQGHAAQRREPGDGAGRGDEPAALHPRPPDQPAGLRAGRAALLRPGRRHRDGRARRGLGLPHRTSVLGQHRRRRRGRDRRRDGQRPDDRRRRRLRPARRRRARHALRDGRAQRLQRRVAQQRPPVRPPPTARPPAATRRRARSPTPPSSATTAPTWISTAPSPASSSPGLNNVQQTQHDFLYDVEPGGYYGAPNPFRDEWVMNGGNPTSGVDVNEVPAYPVGTQPDRNYRGAAYDFGLNYSPDGALEYAGDAFGGALQGKLLVTRYSGGDDIVALTVDDNGEVVDAQTGIVGLGGFTDPLDIAQRGDGSMYVSEFGAQQITLVRPVESGGKAKVVARRTFLNAAAGTSSDAHSFTVRNTGDQPLILSGNTLTFTGPDRALFSFTNGVDANAGEGDGTIPPTAAVQPGESYSYRILFTPPADVPAGTTYNAAVSVRTSDPDAPEVTTQLVALATAGEQGAAEPSLQSLLDLYGFGIDTGDDNPADNDLVPGGDLVAASLFRKADASQAVTVVPIASFGPDSNPAASVGFYRSGRPADRVTLQQISGVQTVDPAFDGAVKFTPPVGYDDTFGLWMQTPSFNEGDGTGRVVYSEDALNTFEPVAAERRKVFTYPLRLADGTTLDNTYVVTFEEFPDATDANDVVLIVKNVVPVPQDGAKLDVQSTLAVPYSESLVFSNIDQSGRSGGEQVRNTQDVTIQNIGNDAVDLTGVSATGLFAVSGFAPLTLAAGESTTFTVDFTATNADLIDNGTQFEVGRVFEGTLGVAADGAADVSLPLRGYHQRYTEDGQSVGLSNSPNAEPSLDQINGLFGYDVDLGTAAARNNRGIVEAVGDEVLSQFWTAAGPDTPVEVYQLNAFHTVPTEDFFAWYPQGQTDVANRVTTNQGQWSQSVLPPGTDGDPLSFGAFTPAAQTFGLRVSNEYSENALNFRGDNDQGHHLRFFPLRDGDGNLVPDTWLAVVDFIGFNFDYNDNTYLVRGMRPADLAPAPVGVSAFRDPNGEAVVDWGGASFLDGYRVYRSVGGRGDFREVTRSVLGQSYFTDTSPPDDDVYYRVYSVNNGQQGMFGEVHIA